MLEQLRSDVIVDQLKVQEKGVSPPFKSQYIQCLAHWKRNTHIPGLHLKPRWCTQPPYATVIATLDMFLLGGGGSGGPERVVFLSKTSFLDQPADLKAGTFCFYPFCF